MPTKKNRGTEGRNLPIFSVGESLGQSKPSGFGVPNPIQSLPEVLNSGGETRGGGKSSVGRLSHGTGDVPNKTSLPSHSGKKTRGLYPKSSS